MAVLADAFEGLFSRRVVLFGGKGGVGKTTLALAAALQAARSRHTILFTSDPVSRPDEMLAGQTLPAGLSIEPFDAGALYERFLRTNLEAFIEIGDRGTYLDREELRRLLELSLPGIDELMAWMRIGELAEQHPDALVVVDTAPTGHTLRMLGSGGHFRQLAGALDAMQGKHRAMVRQFMRREVHDAFDAFIEEFDAVARRRGELLSDPGRAAFVPVTLSEPIVVEQTLRLIAELSIDVPFAVLNRAVTDPDCERDRALAARDADARRRLQPRDVVHAPRSCVPLDSVERIVHWSAGEPPVRRKGRSLASSVVSSRPGNGRPARFLFFAGKGGVGKTTCASAMALHFAHANPSRRYVVISVDPAHSLRDVFAGEAPPPNLAVEMIDTREKWRRFRDSIGVDIADAIGSLTPRGLTVEYDREAMLQLIELAPPGADELFAITRLADLAGDGSLDGVVVDTAPTGHFLRLLDLPEQAAEWLREFMRLLLRYREIVPAGSLGEELVRASRSLRELQRVLHGEDTAVIVVTRPERRVVDETVRLLGELTARGIAAGPVIANCVTPANECRCDRAMRESEMEILSRLPAALQVERRDAPPQTLAAIESLLPPGLKMQP